MAQQYKEKGFVHLEADQYFIESSGEYVFKPHKVPDAHNWCFSAFVKNLLEDNSVVVSNTFIKKWEYTPYVEICKKLSIPYEIIVCEGRWQNVHGVPEEKVEKMRKGFEYGP